MSITPGSVTNTSPAQGAGFYFHQPHSHRDTPAPDCHSYSKGTYSFTRISLQNHQMNYYFSALPSPEPLRAAELMIGLSTQAQQNLP